jgi:hypothetical protein
MSLVPMRVSYPVPYLQLIRSSQHFETGRGANEDAADMAMATY